MNKVDYKGLKSSLAYYKASFKIMKEFMNDRSAPGPFVRALKALFGKLSPETQVQVAAPCMMELCGMSLRTKEAFGDNAKVVYDGHTIILGIDPPGGLFQEMSRAEIGPGERWIHAYLRASSDWYDKVTYPEGLQVWSWEDRVWVVASSADDADAAYTGHIGEPMSRKKSQQDISWTMEPANRMLSFDDGNGNKVTGTCAELAKSRGRGYLCSLDW